MVRPIIDRVVRQIPKITCFIPDGVDSDTLSEEVLSVAECEALRLKHYESLNQLDCAEKMEISQSTFSRILEKAHKKVTISVIEGKSIKIVGGNYIIKQESN